MVVADLHAHTTNSDGTLTLEEVPAVAKAAGLSAVAVTDHDRLHPDLAAVGEYRRGIRLVHGIELRVQAGEQQVDLLGYGVEPTDALVREVEQLQTDRIERARAVVDRLEDRLGVDLDVAFEEGVGRPHVARAAAEATDLTVDEVFDRYIGDGGPCYVARDVPEFATGVELLGEACRLVSLAHPFRYPDPGTALELCADLDGVERFYPYGRPVDASAVDAAVERYDLVPTGGSDAHGRQLGGTGLDAAGYDRFLAAAGLPNP